MQIGQKYARLLKVNEKESMSRKHDNFVRLAEARVNKALDAIRIVGNLSNRAYYEYSEAEVLEIVRALNSSIADLKAQFNRAGQATKQGFRLGATRKAQIDE